MKDFKKMPKWLGSSANPEKIALTIKGISGFIVAIGLMLGVDIESTAVDNALFGIATGASAVITLIGIGRKFYLKFKK